MAELTSLNMQCQPDLTDDTLRVVSTSDLIVYLCIIVFEHMASLNMISARSEGADTMSHLHHSCIMEQFAESMHTMQVESTVQAGCYKTGEAAGAAAVQLCRGDPQRCARLLCPHLPGPLAL